MNLNNVKIEISAVNKNQYPMSNLLEFAFVGRSNVGKSSLINTLINRKSYVRTSAQPGKTRTINFYNIDDTIYFVDLPGYGYAKITKTEKEKWGKMIEDYLKTREVLAGIIMLVDIRHDPTNEDIQMYEWLKYYNYNTIVVCTKADKISKSEAVKRLANIKKIFCLDDEQNIVAFSSIDGNGKDKVWELINKSLDDMQSI